MNAQATLVGNLTKDPDLQFSKTGTAYAKFSLAVNKFKKGKNGADDESIPHFFDITAFGDLAENIAESLRQGDRAVVIGDLNQDTWEADDGTKRSKVTMIASQIGAELSYATCEIEKIEKKATPAKNKSGNDRGPARSSSRSSSRPSRGSRYEEGEEEF